MSDKVVKTTYGSVRRFVVRQAVGAQADFWYVRDRQTGRQSMGHYPCDDAMAIADWLEWRANGRVFTQEQERRILLS